MELLIIIGVMFFLALLLQGRPAVAEETQHIVIVQARPQSSGCMPIVMFVLGLIVAVIVLGRALPL